MTLIVVFITLSVNAFALSESNDLGGVNTITSGNTQTPGDSSPSWPVALDRIGSDGGQLTIELDPSWVFDYEIVSYPQGSMPGLTINLDPGDIFIVWDEDECHGQNLEECTFSGTYTASALNANSGNEYVRATTNDDRTEWTVYTVTGSGTFTVTGTGINEHDAIRINLKLLDFDAEDGKSEDPNNLDCVQPGEEITYTLTWNNSDPNQLLFEDVYIINYLSENVSFVPSSETPDSNYNALDHSYIWYVGTIVPNDTGILTLTVKVNSNVEPGMILYNTAEIHSGKITLARNTESTLICCQWDGFDPSAIYVDTTAKGANNGMTWQGAYSDLQDALYRANNSECGFENGYTIYVAEGIYNAGEFEDDSFAVSGQIKLYGGFKSGGSDHADRNPDKYETTLNGLIDPVENKRNETVVTMGDTAVLDGVSIKGGLLYGIYGSEVSFLVENCRVFENIELGIYTENGNLDVKWCKIEKNGLHGIEHTGEGFAIKIENCVISNNHECGLYATYSTPTISNSVIAQNGSSQNEFDGITIKNPSNYPVLQNNTIAYNNNSGISYFNDDPNSTVYPLVTNCIIWQNNGRRQISGHNPELLSYNCIYDSNDLQGSDYTLDANNNFTGKPGFAYNTPGLYDDPGIEFNPHLAHNSPCVDMGSPHLDYTGQRDTDSEQRQAHHYADIGADEVYTSTGLLSPGDIYTRLDWNADGTVDYKEFASLSQAWLAHDPCDPALYDPEAPEYAEYHNPEGLLYVDDGDIARWNEKYNLENTGDSTYIIDEDDLALFCKNNQWLWVAIWKQSQLNRFHIATPDP